MKAMILAGAALLATSTLSIASDFDTQTVAMSYIQIPLDGHSNAQREPSYGFGVSRLSSELDQTVGGLLNAPRLTDFRFQQGQLQTVTLNNFTFAHRDPETDELNAFGDVNDPVTWVVGGIAVLGVLCATETWICEDDDDNDVILDEE